MLIGVKHRREAAMTLHNPIAHDRLAALRGAIAGDVLSPADAAYEDARRVHNGMIDRRPAAIARCRSARDVAEAIAFARAEGLEIAVRGGGHNVAGRAVCDGGLMIDLSAMQGVEVDPARRCASAEGGVCWGTFNRATQRHGLATTGGAVSSTGVAGLTLGGGLGYLMGRHGYTVDNLLAVELVTADGEILTASEDENAELFWGLRGGGGNFGVATRFDFALHPVGPTVQGGVIMHAFADAGAVLRHARDLAATPDDDLTTVASLTHGPEGEKLVATLVGHFGPEARAAETHAALRGLAPPVIDRLGPIGYSELNELLDAGFPKLARNYWKSCFVDALDDAVVDVLLERFAACPSPMGKLIVERPHGAALRRAPSATAFPHRAPGFGILILAQWTAPERTEENVAWARETYRRLAPHGTSGAYTNYFGDDEAEARVRAAYGPNFARLQALKDRWDPDNVFRLNQNIPPSGR
jgi:FAD/FMN-containing dehydrogenase